MTTHAIHTAPPEADASVPPPAHARSWLLVPATHIERRSAAITSAADAVIVDLEDAVFPTDKPQARDSLASWFGEENHAWVRINDATSTFWDDDLSMLASLPGLQGVVLAKTESADQIQATAARLAAGTKIVALVESAAGIEAAVQIARSDRVFRLAFGNGDFRRDTGAGPAPVALAYARSRLVIGSRIGGLPGPIDGPTLASDEIALKADTELSASMGMTGKLCMRHEQAAIVNTCLAPNQDDLDWAREVLSRLGVDGSRIQDGSDLPRLARARKIVELYEIYRPSVEHGDEPA